MPWNWNSKTSKGSNGGIQHLPMHDCTTSKNNKLAFKTRRQNHIIKGKMMRKPLGCGPRTNQPHIHLISRGYLLGISPFKGMLWGVKRLGYHPEGTRIFPMTIGFPLWFTFFCHHSEVRDWNTEESDSKRKKSQEMLAPAVSMVWTSTLGVLT